MMEQKTHIQHGINETEGWFDQGNKKLRQN